MKAFAEKDSYTYREEKSNQILKEIQNLQKEYILGVDENEYVDFLVSKYSLTEIEVDLDNEIINEPSISKEWTENRWSERYQTDVYTFRISYKFSGSPEVFSVRPDSWTMTTTEIDIDARNSIVSFSFKLYVRDPAEFNRAKEDFKRRAFANLNNSRQFVSRWNGNLKAFIESVFKDHKKKYQQENDFFSAINVKVNKNTASVFSTPTITKKIVPQPTISKNQEFSSEPTMSREMYNDILKVIYESGKNMEKKPALYQNKDEEGLRDQFLFVLETRYEGTTATGETFNRGGKTDIILKYAKDGSNLFVAECKFWHGASEFLKAISQLFDRYLTWRDSKTALIMFVTNKDFTSVINVVREEIKRHEYFTKETEQRGETSFSFIFHLPQDANKAVLFEVMLFHYDK